MVLSDTALTNLPVIISFLVKNIAVGIIVSTSGLGMPGLQGNFKFADNRTKPQSIKFLVTKNEASPRL